MSKLQRLLIRQYAVAFAERAAACAVDALKQSRHRLSDDDSGLVSTWDEICVQVQGEETAFWFAYEAAMNDAVQSCLFGAAEYDLVALWLQTDDGWNWHDRYEDSDEPEDRQIDVSTAPIDTDAIVRHVLRQYVLKMAANDDSPAVRRFFDDRCEVDDYSIETAGRRVDPDGTAI